MNDKQATPQELEVVEVEREDQEARALGTLTKPSGETTLMLRPDVVDIVERRIEALDKIRIAAIKATHPSQWVLFRDKDKKITAYPGSGACVAIGQFYGISVLGASDVKIEVDDDTKLKSAVITGGAHCALTGQVIPGLRAVRTDKEQFVGRSSGIVGDADLKQSAFTLLQSKAVRILSGLTKVSIDTLAQAFGTTPDDVEQAASKGSGFGTSGDRAKARDAFITEPQRKLLWRRTYERIDIIGEHTDDAGRKELATQLIKSVCAKRGYDSSSKILGVQFDDVLKDVATFEFPPATAPQPMP